jgi:hypothetical protein
MARPTIDIQGIVQVGTLDADVVNAQKQTFGGGFGVDASGNLTANSVSVGPYSAVLPSGAATPQGVTTSKIYDIGGSEVNVANYVTVDGATDQITQLQTLFDAMATAPANSRSRRLRFAGLVAISSPLQYKTQAHGRLQLLGATRDDSGLIQLTNNVPIVQFAHTYAEGVVIEEMQLAYASAQGSANTSAQAINLLGLAAGAAYHSRFKRLLVSKANSIAGLQGSSGASGFWDCTFEEIQSDTISRSLLDFTAATPGATPTNYVRGLSHVNGGIAIGSDYAIRNPSGGELMIDQFDLEDWAGPILYHAGGSACSIRHTHLERWTANAGAGLLYGFLIYDGPLKLEECGFSGTPDAGTGSGIFFVGLANAAASVEMDHIRYDLTIAHPTNFVHILANGVPARAWLRDVRITSGTAFALPTAAYGNSLQSIVEFNESLNRVGVLTDAATVAVDASLARYFTLAAAGSRTIGSPTNSIIGMQRIFEILNNTGGAITTTWAGNYTLAGGAWVDPAAGKRRKITFTCVNGTNWFEDSRLAADL